MNDNHSRHALLYRERWIAGKLAAAVRDHPIVVVTGARQVGKSTLLMREPAFREWGYRTLDDYQALSLARGEPHAFLGGHRRLVIDEVQKEPGLLPAIKKAVDRDRTLRFVPSGSANLLLMKTMSESLSGRAVYFDLLPMARSEMKGLPAPPFLGDVLEGRRPSPATGEAPLPTAESVMRHGFMPALMHLRSDEARLQWWEGYVATYLERDLRQLSQVESLVEFRRVMEAVALRSGQILNQTGIARDVGVSQSRVYRYLGLLEASSVLRRVPSFHVNRVSRLIKSPKYYYIDPALAAFLCGHYDAESLKAARELGGLFESLVYLHLAAQSGLTVPAARIYYWRTASGYEVDFILEHGRRLVAVEAKHTSRPGYEDARGLRAFLKEYPEAEMGLLLHTGREVRELGDRILALPWTAIA